MRPSVQLPSDYGLQWYFIEYGAALPPSVIPVMVVPFINETDNVYQAVQDVNGGHDQGFPPPQSLLPSYFNNLYLQTPAETFQPGVHTWPNQVMAPMTAGNQAMAPMTAGNQVTAPMTAGNPAQYSFPSNHSSQTEIHAENKFKSK